MRAASPTARRLMRDVGMAEPAIGSTAPIRRGSASCARARRGKRQCGSGSTGRQETAPAHEQPCAHQPPPSRLGAGGGKSISGTPASASTARVLSQVWDRAQVEVVPQTLVLRAHANGQRGDHRDERGIDLRLHGRDGHAAHLLREGAGLRPPGDRQVDLAGAEPFEHRHVAGALVAAVGEVHLVRDDATVPQRQSSAARSSPLPARPRAGRAARDRRARRR